MTPPTGTAKRTLALGGDTIALWERPGASPSFVFVHGNGASKEAFRPLFDSPRLAGHRLIAFDLPGSGESSDARDPANTYTLPALGQLIVAVVNALKAEPYILVGWSLGGHLAIQALVEGAKPRGVVLTGTPPCGPDPAEIAESFLPIPAAAFVLNPAPDAALLEVYLKAVYAPAVPTEAYKADAVRADGRMRARLFEHIFATPQMEPQRTTIGRWEGPFALIQGPDEPFFRAAAIDTLPWRHLWRGGTQWIAGAGHAPFVSHPDAYASLLTAFAADAQAPNKPAD